MDEELMSDIFEKVNRGYKQYIKGIIQYHHEYLAQNPTLLEQKKFEQGKKNKNILFYKTKQKKLLINLILNPNFKYNKFLIHLTANL